MWELMKDEAEKARIAKTKGERTEERKDIKREEERV